MRGEQQKAAPSRLLVVRQDRWRLVTIFADGFFGVVLDKGINVPCIRIQSSTANVTATLHLNCNAFLCNRPRVELLSLVCSHQLKISSFPIFAISLSTPEFTSNVQKMLTWTGHPQVKDPILDWINVLWKDSIRNRRCVKSSQQFWKVMWIKWKREEAGNALNLIQKAVSHPGWTCGVRLLKVTQARQKAATFHFRWLNQLLLALCGQEL